MTIYRIGAITCDEGYELVKDKHEFEGTLEDARNFCKSLLRDILSGFAIIQDGDYVEQIGEYDGEVDFLIERIDRRYKN